MKKRIFIGLSLGLITGLIDIVPMIIQKLSWDANFSALSLWIVSGFFISSSKIELNPIIKGILISFLTLLPSAILIGWQEPKSLFPISITTTVLGGLLGYLINTFNQKFL